MIQTKFSCKFSEPETSLFTVASAFQ